MYNNVVGAGYMILNNILKVTFAAVGVLTGYTLANVLDKYNGMWGLRSFALQYIFLPLF